MRGTPIQIGGLVARSLTYFDGQVNMACLLCETLPTVENGGVTADMTPEGTPGQKVVFRLKPNLKWDDGAPVTAADVVLAWKAGRQPSSNYAWQKRLAEEIWQVSARDDRTVEVRRRGQSCTPADFRFLPLPSRLEAAAVEGGNYATESLYVRAPTTSGLYNGPYRVSEKLDQKLILTRNPHWAGQAPAYDRVELVYRPNAAVMVDALAAGEVDLLTDVSASTADQATRKVPDRIVAVSRPGRSTMQVTLNHDDPRLADTRVRKALLLALDRPALAASYGKGAVSARSFLTPRFPYYDAGITDRPARIEEANRLLDQAGWKAGRDGVRRNAKGEALSFRFAVSPSAAQLPFATLLTNAWRRIGVETRIEAFTGIGQLTAKNPPPLAMFGYTLEGGQNIDFHVFNSHNIPKEGEVRNGLNIFRYRNAEVDNAVAQLRDGCSPDELAPAYRTLQRRVAEDVPFIPLFFMPEAHLLPRDFPLPDAERIQFLQTEEIEYWGVRRR